MSKVTNVFHLWQPQTDYNETNIWSKLNADIDWSIFRRTAEGEILFENYTPIQFKLRTNKILKHGLIRGAGNVQILSQKALDVIGLEALSDFKIFPVFVNNAPYFALYALKKTDCLDLNNSQYTELNIGDDGFYEISKHAFHLNKIKESSLFFMHKSSDFLYCTGDIGRKILENELVIMAQPLIEEVEDLRKEVVYDNPIVGISFTEPRNWQMEGTVYEQLKTGKKLTEKAWKSEIPSNKDDISLVYMQRFRLLKENNWLNKASISINISKRKAEDIFQKNEQPFSINHSDKDFKGQINEGQFYITLVAPYKNDLSFDVRIVSWDDDKKYLEEAKKVFQNIRFK